MIGADLGRLDVDDSMLHPSCRKRDGVLIRRQIMTWGM